MDSASIGYHLADGTGPAWRFLNTKMTVKAGRAQTGGAYALLEVNAPHGFGPPRHVHHEEDEAFIVLDGEAYVACGEQTWKVASGSFVYLPRKVPHAWLVTSDRPLVGWQFTTPAGFDDLVAELGSPVKNGTLPDPAPPDIARFAAVAARHHNEVVGPPLDLRDLTA